MSPCLRRVCLTLPLCLGGMSSTGLWAEAGVDRSEPGEAAAGTSGQLVMQGRYTWGRRAKPDQTLTCTLTPTEEQRWTVVFDFPWKGRDYRYTGELVGDPLAGEVTGTAQSSNGKRSWKIVGSATEGTLEARHWETSKGEEQFSGTFTVVRQAGPD